MSRMDVTPPNRAQAESWLRRQVYGGVTSIRDMADDLRQVADLARATLVGEIPGPEICYAALMAGPTFFDDPRTWQVSQGATPGQVPWMQAVTEGTDLPLAVARAAGTSASAVKVYANLPGPTVAAIAAEAHCQGLGVWAHAAVFPATPGEVVAAGADVVSHVTLLVHDDAPRPLTSYRDKPPVDHARFTGGQDPAMAALLAEMARRGTILDATAGLWAWLAEQDDATPEERDRALADSALAAALTAQAHRAGVAVSTGTDYETGPEDPWPSLHAELRFLVERCGLSTAEVIRAATRTGARSMGREEELGTVEAGKLADFVVLAEDPLADLAALRSICFTVKHGHRFDRADYTPKG